MHVRFSIIRARARAAPKVYTYVYMYAYNRNMRHWLSGMHVEIYIGFPEHL